MQQWPSNDETMSTNTKLAKQKTTRRLSMLRHAASPGTVTNTLSVLWTAWSAPSLATTRTLQDVPGFKPFIVCECVPFTTSLFQSSSPGIDAVDEEGLELGSLVIFRYLRSYFKAACTDNSANANMKSSLTVFYIILHKNILLESKVFPTDHCTSLNCRCINRAKHRAKRRR